MKKEKSILQPEPIGQHSHLWPSHKDSGSGDPQLKQMISSPERAPMDNYLYESKLQWSYSEDGNTALPHLQCIRSTLLGYHQDRMYPLQVKDIAFIYSTRSHVSAYTNKGKTFMIKSTLDNLQLMLSRYQFFRATRQFLINRDHVEFVEPYFSRRHLVTMKTPVPEKIIISKARSPEMFNWLQL